ncbi:uncharacterized protein LOC126843879 [Adelges cooleyi]|uniref:uncharacterized protein LOC126843879 n=1 Tax=Adelges cooleyi TaxID=133065 RepID=UPI0021803265|nr:uncharacterized protein LOC126843879 [Adelges cooleyi]
MNSIMRLRCVMLFVIFSFGLIISLHAASPPRTSSPDTPPSKRHKSSEEADNEGVEGEDDEDEDEEDEDEGNIRPLDDDAIDDDLNSYSPMTSLRLRLTEPYLYNCLQKKETGEFDPYKLHPFYSDAVEDAEKLIIDGNDGEARKILTTATQAMMVLEEVDCADVLVDKEAVDSMWENWHDDTVTDQVKEGVLKKIEVIVEKFITDVKNKK